MTTEEYQIQQLKNNNFHLQKQIERLEKELAERKFEQLKERKFWTEDPGLWFALTEAEFKVTGITDDLHKYNYVITQLDQEVLIKIQDVICNPPMRAKYNKLKEELIRRYAEPEAERIRRLFDEKLGDRTPSQFYRHLKYIAGPELTVDKILLHFWMRQLPKQCQQILACRPEQSNIKLAELADSIVDMIKVSEQSEKNKLQDSIDELNKKVVALKVKVRDRSRSQSRSSSMQRSPSKARDGESCWYHRRWGSQAYRCIKPCGWRKS